MSYPPMRALIAFTFNLAFWLFVAYLAIKLVLFLIMV